MPGRKDARALDRELVGRAQVGDVAALGALLQRHGAGMRAVALALLGPGPDVDDVLQGAALVALRRIGAVRDPEAVGAWLRMIVRNNCRALLRASVPQLGLDQIPHPDPEADPEQVLERHAMRDWVWTAVEELSDTLRLPLVLRHFTEGVTSYERIAEVCGVPEGTVRSRLHQARAKLAGALAATADAAHGDVRERTAAGWAEARYSLAGAEAGHFGKVLAQGWSPQVALMTGAVRLDGADLLMRAMDGDLAAGVRQRPVNVTAGESLAVWEMEIANPADDPEHCPPAVAWIMSLEGGRVSRLRLSHPRPLRAALARERGVA